MVVIWSGTEMATIIIMATLAREASRDLADTASQARVVTVDTASRARADTTLLTTIGALHTMTGARPSPKMTGALPTMTGALLPTIGLAGTPLPMIGLDHHGGAVATGQRYPVTAPTTAAKVARAVLTDMEVKVARVVRTDTASQVRDPRVDTTVHDAVPSHPSSSTSTYQCLHPFTLLHPPVRRGRAERDLTASLARADIMMMIITTARASLARDPMVQESLARDPMVQESLVSRDTREEVNLRPLWSLS